MRSILIIVTLLWSASLWAQPNEWMKMANAYYDAYAYDKAIPLYRDVLMQDNSLEAKQKLADAYRMVGNLAKAEYWYRRIIAKLPPNPVYKLQFARILQSNGKCKEAKKWFLEYGKVDPLGEELASGCDRITAFSKNKDRIDVGLLPINSKSSDFSPAILQNGLVFCSDRDGGARGQAFLDIYYTEKQGNDFIPPVKLKGGVNSQFNDGPVSITGGKLFFTRNAFYKVKDRKGKIANINIFESDIQLDGKWSDPIPFQHNFPDHFVGHPAATVDGNTLYFVSDMPGGFGGKDIYVSTRKDSLWSKPINLGPEINTSANETFPFIHADGTLYFASDGHAGLGGLDIFMSQRQGYKWTKPENLGMPINTVSDDFGIVLDENRESGYFSSNRSNGFGKDDIYYFAPKNRYPSFAAQARTIPKVHANDLGLTTNRADQLAGMKKVNFNAGDWEVLPKASNELDKLYTYLRQHPDVFVEIAVHTDSRGDDYVNSEISTKRAEAALAYLVLKGLEPHRARARGYGETKLLNHCVNGASCNNKEHNINNRLEVYVLSSSGTANMPDPYIQPTPIPQPITQAPPNKVGATPIIPPKKKSKNKNKEKEKKRPKLSDLDSNSDGYIAYEKPDSRNIKELAYKIFIGPYRELDDPTYYTFAELNTPIDMLNDERGTIIVLGPYRTIQKAEEYKQYVMDRGGKKPKIVVFSGGVETDMNVKKLKKLGVK